MFFFRVSTQKNKGQRPAICQPGVKPQVKTQERQSPERATQDRSFLSMGSQTTSAAYQTPCARWTFAKRLGVRQPLPLFARRFQRPAKRFTRRPFRTRRESARGLAQSKTWRNSPHPPLLSASFRIVCSNFVSRLMVHDISILSHYIARKGRCPVCLCLCKGSSPTRLAESARFLPRDADGNETVDAPCQTAHW